MIESITCRNRMASFVSSMTKAVEKLSEYLNIETAFGLFVNCAEEAVQDVLTTLSKGPGHQVEARMRLTELQHLLRRCRQVIATGNEQIGSCAKIGSGRLGRELKRQLEQKELDLELATVFLDEVKSRLGDICQTTRRLQQMGAVEEIQTTKSQVISLNNQRERAERMRTIAGAFKTIVELVMVGGVAYLLFYCPAGAAAVAKGGATVLFEMVTSQATAAAAFKAFLAFLCLGATATLAEEIKERAYVLVSRLKELTDSFVEVHKQLEEVHTLTKGINESTTPTETNLKRALKHKAPANFSQELALETNLKILLEGLEKLKSPNEGDE